MPGAWAPTLLRFSSDAQAAGPSNRTCHVTLDLGFNETLHADYGAPVRVTAEYRVDAARRRVDVSLTWRNKTATRLLEAMTVFNRPGLREGYRWEMDKLGEWVPCANVTEGGNQYQHAVWTGVRYAAVTKRAAAPGLWLSTLDAGMVCPVLNSAADPALTPEASLRSACFDYHIPSSRDPTPGGPERQLSDAMIDGLGFNLHNNRFTISGFPQWYPFGVGGLYQKHDETTQFRFVLEER